jgi:hypothetical protein
MARNGEFDTFLMWVLREMVAAAQHITYFAADMNWAPTRKPSWIAAPVKRKNPCSVRMFDECVGAHGCPSRPVETH